MQGDPNKFRATPGIGNMHWIEGDVVNSAVNSFANTGQFEFLATLQRNHLNAICKWFLSLCDGLPQIWSQLQGESDLKFNAKHTSQFNWNFKGRFCLNNSYLPTTFKYPTWLFIGSVLIWHMYHPLSDSCTSLRCKYQIFCSTWVTAILWFLVITCTWMVRIVWVSTLNQAT